MKFSEDPKLKNRLLQCLTYIQISKNDNQKHTISPAIKSLLPLIKFYIVDAETSFTDCVSNIYISTSHMQLPAKQLAFIICHEISHILFLHSVRSSMFEFEKEHLYWNYATDYFINSLLETYKEALEVPQLKDSYGNPFKICLDKNYSHENTGEEEILKKILIDKPNLNLPSSGGGNGNSQGNSSDGDKSNQQSHNGSFDTHSIWKGKDEQDSDEKIKVNAIKKVVRDLQKSAEEDKEIMAGKGDAILGRLHAIYVSKENDWEKKLRFYLVKTFERAMKYNYHRNARNNLTQFFIPASMKLKKPKPKFLFAIDTSLSVTDKQLALFKGEIYRIINAGGVVDFIACHDRITFKVENATKKDVSNFAINETGGTSFDPVFDFAKKNKKKYDIVVYLTDGFGRFNYLEYPEFKKNTLWLINCGGTKAQAKSGVVYVENSFPNYGKIIPIG